MNADHKPGAKYERLIAKAKGVTPPAVTLVVHPCDETSLRGPIEARMLQEIRRQRTNHHSGKCQHQKRTAQTAH